MTRNSDGTTDYLEILDRLMTETGEEGTKRRRRHREELLEAKRFVDEFRFVAEEFPLKLKKEGGDFDDGSGVSFPDMPKKKRPRVEEADGIDERRTIVEEEEEKEKTGGLTPLLLACQEGDRALALALLSAGADANAARSPDGVTPLMLASASGDDTLVRALLSAGADARAENWRGATAVHLAAAAVPGGGRVLETLKRRGAPLNAPTRAGVVPLLPACAAGETDAVVCLLNVLPPRSNKSR